MPERRFNEAEVAAILEWATTRHESGRQLVPSGEGLTLGQLQEIGREIGVEPDTIAQAIDRLDHPARTATRRVLGLPLGVERIVPLTRRLTDDEWDRVVVHLREIFNARGKQRHEGSLREWTNGNLQALLEPAGNGHRIRLRTFKGNAPVLLTVGALSLAPGAFFLSNYLYRAFGAGNASVTEALVTLSFMVVAGGGIFGTTVARLFPWARRRAEQMAEVEARVTEMFAIDPAP